MAQEFTFTVNGVEHTTTQNKPLLRYLRDDLHLHSVKDGCSEGACGTCTILVDGKAAGVITEEAGANSHSAIVGLTLNKAVIVGATNATRTLKDGMVISMDCIRGTVQLMAD